MKVLVYVGLLLSVALAPAAATQLEPRLVYSPINGKPYQLIDIPVTGGHKRVLDNQEKPSAGSDTDGCRHDDINIYDHYVATCPYTYFTSLAIEYGPKGRFMSELSPEFKRWVTSKDGFNSEWEIDKNHFYDRARRIANGTGQKIPQQKDWVIPQRFIPVENKYRYCYMSYLERGASDSFLGKVSLTGAWALRAKMNVAFHDVRLKGGIEEINERLERHLEPGAPFELEKVHQAYHDIFHKARLSDEGYFVAGITLIGLELRVGNLEPAFEIVDRMLKRMDDRDNELHRFFRGLIEDRRRLIKRSHIAELPPGPNDYMDFLTSAAFHFSQAIMTEEIPRSRMLEILFTIAECYRRLDENERAYDWYLTLANMEETQPSLRQDIRDQGRVPSVEATTALMLGWQSDEAMRELEQQGVSARDAVQGRDGPLLNAVLNQGLGTLEYADTGWKPRKGGNRRESAVFLQEIGLTVLDFAKRSGRWPDSLGELWVTGLVSDWNTYNRFHCPVTGEPYRYQPIGQDVDSLPQDLIVVSTSAPLPGPQGPEYAAFTSSLKLVWSDKPLEPGTFYAE